MANEIKTTTAMTPFEPENLEQAMRLSSTLSQSALLPDALKGKPADVLLILMSGRELGLSPMQSIRGMTCIKGRPVINADMMVGLCQRNSAICERFVLCESTDKVAVFEAKRVGCQPVKLSFSLEQAKQAGLLGKDNWAHFPAAMLRARCSSHLARAVFPDLVAGLYESDEFEAVPVPAPKPPPAVAREINRAPPPLAPVAPVIEDAQISPVAEESKPAPQAAAPEREPGEDIDEPQSDEQAVLTALAAATTEAAVKSLVPAIQALPEEAKERVRPHYAEAAKALKGKV